MYAVALSDETVWCLFTHYVRLRRLWHYVCDLEFHKLPQRDDAGAGVNGQNGLLFGGVFSSWLLRFLSAKSLSAGRALLNLLATHDAEVGYLVAAPIFGRGLEQEIRDLGCLYTGGDFSNHRDFLCVTVRVHESEDETNYLDYGRGFCHPYLSVIERFLAVGLAINHENTPGQSLWYHGEGTLLLKRRTEDLTQLNNHYCETVQAMRVPPSDSARRTKDGVIEPMTISVVLSNNRMWIIIDRMLYDFSVFAVLRGEDLPGIDMRSNPTDLLVPLIMSGMENRVEIVEPDASFDRIYIPGSLFTGPRELPVGGVSG